MEVTNTLKKHITESPLTDNEKEVLFEKLSAIDKKHIEELNTIFDESPWMVPYLYINFASKKYAIESGDMDSFRQVVDKEVKVLEKVFDKES